MMRNSVLKRYCLFFSILTMPTLSFSIELELIKPIKSDLGFKIEMVNDHVSYVKVPEGISEKIQLIENAIRTTLSASYYGKYDLVYETTFGAGAQSTVVSIFKDYSKEVTFGQPIGSPSSYFLGESIKYRLALPVGYFTFAALPFLGLQYSYAALNEETYTYERTGVTVVNTNHLLSLNSGMGFELIYNKIFGIFGEFCYRYGFYNHYSKDISYQFPNEPKQTISIHQRINNFGFGFGLKIYFRKKSK